MEVISDQMVNRLTHAAGRVSDMVDSGLTPNQAVLKCAKDMDIAPDFVDLLCKTYNVGAFTAQRLQASTTQDKLAAFPLADYNQIQPLLVPVVPDNPQLAKHATAVDSMYALPPSRDVTERHRRPQAPLLEKAAADLRGAWGLGESQPPTIDAQQASQARREALQAGRRIEDGLREKAAGQERHLRQKLAQVHAWFQQNYAQRQKLAEYQFNSNMHWGYPSQQLWALLGLTDTQKVASITHEFHPTAAPYNLLHEAIQASQAMLAAQSEHLAEKQANAQRDQEDRRIRSACWPQAPKPPRQFLVDEDEEPLQKEAVSIMGMTAASALGGLATRGIGGSFAPRSQLVDRATQDLGDPIHERQLESIHRQATIQELMSHDPIISSYGPQEVLAAVNEISEVLPTGSSNVATLRPWLRRRLMGDMATHETEQLLNAEQKSRSLRTPNGVPASPANATLV